MSGKKASLLHTDGSDVKDFFELNRFLLSFCIFFSIYIQKQQFPNRMLILVITEIQFLLVCYHDHFPTEFRRNFFHLMHEVVLFQCFYHRS